MRGKNGDFQAVVDLAHCAHAPELAAGGGEVEGPGMMQKTIGSLAAAIVATCLIASPAWSQQNEAGEQPAQVESGPEVGGEAGANHDPSVDMTTALKDIEAAIRDVVAAEEPEDRRRRQDQEARDLKAQEEMARWAFWTLVASAATAAVTAAGFYLIWRTLIATRQATAVANRAWLLIKPLNAKAVVSPDGKVTLWAEVEIANTGATPAMDASTDMICVWTPDNIKGTGTKQILKNFAADLLREKPEPVTRRFVMPGEKYVRNLIHEVHFGEHETPSTLGLVAFVCTTYRVAYEDTPRQTAIVYMTTWTDRTDRRAIVGDVDLEALPPHDGFLT